MTDNMEPPLHARQPPAPHSPARHLLVGLLLAPLAWLAQMMIAETLAAQSCYPFDRPLSAPAVPWMRAALVTISALCLAAGAFGALSAWRNVRRLEPGKAGKGGRSNSERQRHLGLEAFLVRIAAMCSALFLFALIATDLALALVSPCKWW
jgi:hypothetical protein